MSLFHVYTQYSPKDPATAQRNSVAALTWAKQLWTERPVRDEDLPRMWNEEGRSFPYLKDVIDFGVRDLRDSDIAVYTNADICVRTNCSLIVAWAMQDTDAIYSYRRDFDWDFNAPLPDEQIERGHDYAGSDLKAFRAGWWRKHREEMPDMILGMEAWDPIFRHLIELTNPGVAVSVPNTHYHRRHASYWENPQNRYRLEGQKLCLRLAKEWLYKHGIDPGVHGIPR